MKRIVFVASALVLAFSLCACDDGINTPAAAPTAAQTSQSSVTTPLPSTPVPEEGRGDIVDDAETPNWWGEYKSDEAYASVAVTNLSGASFSFAVYFLRDGSLLFDGVAALDPNDNLRAEYGDISFLLSSDYGAIDVLVPEGAEWSHLSGLYGRIGDGDYAEDGYNSSLRLDFNLDGLVWDSSNKYGNKYTLDDEVYVYSDTIGDGNDIQAQIEDYLRLQDYEVSEWLSLEMDEALTEKLSYPVWIAEYYVGNNEDTNLCVDAVVLSEQHNVGEYAMILHTIRDADLDMNSDTDFGARISELFATIEVATD